MPQRLTVLALPPLVAAAMWAPAGAEERGGAVAHPRGAATSGETIGISRSGGKVTIVGTGSKESISADQLDRSVAFTVAAPGAFAVGSGCAGDEHQVVCRGVESVSIRFGAGDDRFRDTNAPRYRLTVDGGPGDDDVLSATPNTVRMVGGAGDDTLHLDTAGSHARTLLGGDGDDDLFGGYGTALATGRGTLDGGDGDDRVTGGAGVDRIRGGDGRDVVTSTDRHRDRVDCGPGRDRIRADSRDALTRCP
jgi:Ca2+-binding RTX toxin-like protein